MSRKSLLELCAFSPTTSKQTLCAPCTIRLQFPKFFHSSSSVCREGMKKTSSPYRPPKNFFQQGAPRSPRTGPTDSSSKPSHSSGWKDPKQQHHDHHQELYSHHEPDPHHHQRQQRNRNTKHGRGRERHSRSLRPIKPVPIGRKQVEATLLAHLGRWGETLETRNFLVTLGIYDRDRTPVLRSFRSAVRQEILNQRESDEHSEEGEAAVGITEKSTTKKITGDAGAATSIRKESDWVWDWDELQEQISSNVTQTLDRVLMSRFLNLMPVLDPTRCGALRAVQDALVLPHPAELHAVARQVRRRIIMHVGPTNSGKTYHALRALAAANYGCYAGPLRLLATEIYGRLNRGEIAPTGQDPSLKYPRMCNLVTGEDIKILDEDAPLMSATVEMVPLTKKFDVVVIDEIQMIAHPERGNAWTQALLGLNAEEIHLCGEESAVDLVRELVRATGDELVVNTYQRLTPLEMAPRPLGANFSDLRPGDCVIGFSRNAIFGIKSTIEEKTGLQCAVVYGKLPPEVRVEQATKFNAGDKDNYPVLVASDAIGMGLNLKIKRVIFSTVSKFNGLTMVQLPLSEIKQIGGRAGRYGMHGPDSVGTVTTFFPKDHRVVAEALKTPVPELKVAILAADGEWLTNLHRTLPPHTGLAALFQLLQDVAVCGPPFQLSEYSKLLQAAQTIDEACPNLSISTRSTIAQAPVPWAIPEAPVMFKKMLSQFSAGEMVDVETIFQRSGLLMILEDVMAAREEQAQQNLTLDPSAEVKSKPKLVLSIREAGMRLEGLELLHKMACVYLWMSYRFPIAFSKRERVEEIKLATELGIQFCLEAVSEDRARQFTKRLEDAEQEDQKVQQGEAKTTAGTP
ncbi:RNA helicase [Serendipita sp. 398]|nr:RNA helicase [Serendipita sp. 398]